MQPPQTKRCRDWAGVLAALLVVGHAGDANGENQRNPSVGIPAKIDQLVLPGSPLEVKPIEDRLTPIVMRIVATFPHGTAFRYDIVYYGLEPGTFDLKDYLRRKDGSSTDDLPSVAIEIRSVLPPGQIVPHAVETGSSLRLGGYRLLLTVGGALWLIGLVLILTLRRGKRGGDAQAVDQPRTLADRLRPIIQNAMDGRITGPEQAKLERLLLAYWRRRLDLDEQNAADALAVLRQHDEAGALMRQLEAWLHQPGTADHVDVAVLLEPYQSIPADVLETETQSAK